MQVRLDHLLLEIVVLLVCYKMASLFVRPAVSFARVLYESSQVVLYLINTESQVINIER